MAEAPALVQPLRQGVRRVGVRHRVQYFNEMPRDIAYKSTGSPDELRAAVNLRWGLPHVNQATAENFLLYTQAVARQLEEKATLCGFQGGFSSPLFYGGACGAVKAHYRGKMHGPFIRNSGEPDLFHMLRLLGILADKKYPWLGIPAYIASWFHDASEGEVDLPPTICQLLYGDEVFAIVDALTKRFPSEHHAPEKYISRFSDAVQKYPAILFIKLADSYDYFDTVEIGGISQDSIERHYRFVHRVLLPLASRIRGAWRPTLDLANLALEKADPDLFAVLKSDLASFADALSEHSASTLAQLKQITRGVSVRRRSPIELALRWRAVASPISWQDIIVFDFACESWQEAKSICAQLGRMSLGKLDFGCTQKPDELSLAKLAIQVRVRPHGHLVHI